jgi:hypothetical protein
MLIPARPGRRRWNRRWLLQMPEQPGVHPPVDLLADPLDEALRHGRVVTRPEILVCARRRPDFIPDAHVVTLQKGRHRRHWC